MEFKTEKDFGGYWIKNLKNFKAHDCEPLFQCSVYKDGKRIGFFSEDGWGGPAHLNEFKPEDEKSLCQYAKEYEGVQGWAESYHTFISTIASAVDLQRLMKRKCNKSCLFFLSGDSADTYRTLGVPWQNNKGKIKALLTKKYGAGFVIINELLATL